MANEMKSSNAVMDVVRNYMEERCASDPILAIKYANPAKSLEKALNYVAHEVQKSGLTIMDSDSVFSLILHYYDENLEDVPNVNCKIAVAKELTDTERAEAKEQAMEQYKEEQLREIRRQRYAHGESQGEPAKSDRTQAHHHRTESR